MEITSIEKILHLPTIAGKTLPLTCRRFKNLLELETSSGYTKAIDWILLLLKTGFGLY